MQENEFEKNMQQKMDAFQLHPSEAAWENIQVKLAGKKEERRKYLIFSLLLLAFLAGAFWLFKPHSSLTTAGKHENKNASVSEYAPIINKTEPGQQDLTTGNQGPAVTGSVIENTSENTINRSSRDEILTSDKKIERKANKKAIKGRAKIEISPTVIDEVNEAPAKTGPTKNNSTTSKDIENASNTIPQETKTGLHKTDTIQVAIQSQLPAPIQQPKEETKKNVSAKKGKWNIGLVASAGISSLRTVSAGGNTSADFNSGVGATPNANAPYPVSPLKPYMAATAGVSVSRSLSSKLEVATGLQYQLFTATMPIGDRVTTQAVSQRNLFRSGSRNKYVSFYHLLSLPVNIKGKIATIGKREVLVNAGMNISRLLNTNALQFDSMQGTYYKNNSVFNKTIFGLTASVSINLSSQGKAPFYIGPDFYYSPTPQASSGIYKGLHYKSFGIRIEKILWNK